MKNNVWLMISVSMIIFLLSWCQQWKINDKNIVISPTFSQDDLAISDPEIKKEIDYLRDNKIISPETHARWQKLPKNYFMIKSDGIKNEKWEIWYDDMYIIPPYQSISLNSGQRTDWDYIDRSFIQEKMKENKNL